ncbi:DinB family protein [Hymenobacter properus]|uniref:DinB family protein n=1 Tax=Hymenobacter properus TaxID=2791026 RepID=A0A931FK55_9BACT|nr:DinB family protein [Hymenobacter properus]MBF9142663.1 DinB family protein [Hymenobacter properus]MBR7721471.1 DinB family protein [Microvirga sp. SRT04]
MSSPAPLEIWLRGPIAGVPPLLQPVAHALLQARDEVRTAMQDFPPELVNERPGGVASVGFHLQHLAGVLDRLLTYARQETLTEAQFAAFNAEVPPLAISHDTVEKLVQEFSSTVEKALAQLRATDEATLTEVRGVGRAQVPSTHLGLLFHAAEHTMRHLGQLLVTAQWVRSLA